MDIIDVFDDFDVDFEVIEFEVFQFINLLKEIVEFDIQFLIEIELFVEEFMEESEFFSVFEEVLIGVEDIKFEEIEEEV